MKRTLSSDRNFIFTLPQWEDCIDATLVDKTKENLLPEEKNLIRFLFTNMAAMTSCNPPIQGLNTVLRLAELQNVLV